MRLPNQQIIRLVYLLIINLYKLLINSTNCIKKLSNIDLLDSHFQRYFVLKTVRDAIEIKMIIPASEDWRK